MDHTFTQIHIQIVFAVEGRQPIIREEIREEVQKYMAGIVRKRDHKLLAIYCMPDHTHLLVGLRPDRALNELVEAIKTGSRDLINQRRWCLGRFGWQEGFGAFSYGHSQVDRVVRYIHNQPRHHLKQDYNAEFLELLRRFGIKPR